ncbi:hypothetical protein [uncultured Selenomonas sp.]|uniref:hypothetical protein n=1 Tax=uncultured Selenomonas sp. TaxID=159275 RepID=UPI0025F6698F|nr:hypothetical protein [uncultured Selenomonas sp.]
MEAKEQLIKETIQQSLAAADAARDPKAVNGVHLSATHWSIYKLVKGLAKKHTYCYAGNNYIARELHLSRSRISHCITDLCHAGMLCRRCHAEDSEHPQWITRRDLLPVPKKIYENIPTDAPEVGEHIATLMEALHGYAVRKEDDKKQVAQRRRLFHKAQQNGILKHELIAILHSAAHWPLDYIEEKLGILTASISVESPIRFLWAALKGDWKPGRKAKCAAKKATAPKKVTPERASIHYEPRPVTEEYVPETRKTREDRIKRWLHPGSTAYKKQMAYIKATSQA